MTQPDQTQPIYPPQEWPIPDTQNEPETPDDRTSIDLYPTIGQGALTIDDGGGYYNYNQDLTEDDGRGEWQFPSFAGDDEASILLGILRDILGRLPFPALQVLETWLAGGVAIFESVTDAIEKIMNALRPGTIALRWNQFLEMLVGWVEATPGDLDNWLLSLVGIDSVSTGSFSKESPELLKNPWFATPVSLANGSTPGWHLDDEDKHSEKGNSAAIETDVVQMYTIISSAVRVEAEKILELRAHLKWEGITSASGADAITLCLLPDGADPETGAIILDTIPLNVAKSDETTDWIEIDGRYTMPDEETFPAARLMVRLESLNVGAIVKVSDVSFKKALPAQWWPLEWVDGLADAFNAVDEFIQNIIGAILGGFVDGDQDQWNLIEIFNEFTSWFLGTEDTYALASDNQFNLADTINDTIASFFGLGGFDYDTPAEGLESQKAAMDSVYDSIQGVSTKVNELWNREGGGAFYSVGFIQYPDGDFTTAGVPFTMTYSGAGDGTVGVYSGMGVWNEGTPGGNREAVGIYTDAVDGDEMDTDFVLFTATVAGIPEIGGFSSPYSGVNTGIVRANAAGTTYVYASGYRVGLFGVGVNAEIGCVVSGVKTVWATGINATYEPNLTIVAGVDGNPYRFRIFSGSKEIYDYTDTLETSQKGVGFRNWGYHVATGNSGYASPASAGYLSCADI